MNSKSRCNSKSKISLFFSIKISNWYFIIVSFIFIINYFSYNYFHLHIFTWKPVHHRRKITPLYIILRGNRCLTRGKPLLNMAYYVAISIIFFITDMQYLFHLIPWYWNLILFSCIYFVFDLILYFVWNVFNFGHNII